MLKDCPTQIALNARFRRAKRLSGVQNWSAHVADALNSLEGIVVNEYIPHPFFATGIRGHLWEQVVLPLKARKSNILLSPGNSGPIFSPKQLVCVHDAMVFTHPKFFTKSYRAISKILLKSYSPRRTRILTVSNSSMEAIRQVVSSEMVITVVGVGLPHMEFGLFEQSNEDYFLFIGGDIERKNLNFLLAFWGHIYETTRYKLVVVVGKNSSSLRTTPLHKMDGVKYILEPDNLALSRLYQGSRALLWPSMAEGFGIPLLEAMSFGRPFVSTPVGAANELRTGESVVLPPDKLLWQNQIIKMVLNPQNDSAEQIKKTYEYTWDEVSYRIKKEIAFFLN